MVFYKRKGYPVDQKLDVIEKNGGHFRIQRPKVSQKQVSDVTQQKLCSPYYWCKYRWEILQNKGSEAPFLSRRNEMFSNIRIFLIVAMWQWPLAREWWWLLRFFLSSGLCNCFTFWLRKDAQRQLIIISLTKVAQHYTNIEVILYRLCIKYVLYYVMCIGKKTGGVHGMLNLCDYSIFLFCRFLTTCFY